MYTDNFQLLFRLVLPKFPKVGVKVSLNRGLTFKFVYACRSKPLMEDEYIIEETRQANLSFSARTKFLKENLKWFHLQTAANDISIYIKSKTCFSRNDKKENFPINLFSIKGKIWASIECNFGSSPDGWKIFFEVESKYWKCKWL